MRVFSREGEYWTIRYAGRLVRVRDTKGIGCLATLLGHPGARVHVSMLTGDGAADGDPHRVEQERVNVTKGIRVAIRRIADHHPDLGLHLEQSIRTGTYCSYSPVVSGPLMLPGGQRRGKSATKRR
jgi:hypothetical protein